MDLPTARLHFCRHSTFGPTRARNPVSVQLPRRSLTAPSPSLYHCFFGTWCAAANCQQEKILFHWNSAECSPAFTTPTFPPKPEVVGVFIGISPTESEVMVPEPLTHFPASWPPSHKLGRRRSSFLRRPTPQRLVSLKLKRSLLQSR